MPPKKKVINDPIHGLIELDAQLFRIIDTPEFQRLRDLKQLGGNYFVFPGASHNRFEHCLGTCYLAGQWMRHFQQTSSFANISDRDVFLVEVAGLCHDLGHGPFSHTFETTLHRRGIEWDHELASCKLLEIINNRVLLLSPSELSLVKHMILGHFPAYMSDKRFMFMIVHNSITGVDVDKFDYLRRDCYSASLPLGFKHERLLQFSRICPRSGEICFNEKEALNLFELFNARYALHKQVYSHTAVKGVELMIGDILFEANEYFKISETIKAINDDPEDLENYKSYIHFTDGMLTEIERIPSSSNENITKAKQLLVDLRSRKFYTFVIEASVSRERLKEANSTAEAVQAYIHKKFPESIDSIYVYAHSYDFGKKELNPLNEVKFYSSDPSEASTIPFDRISGLYSTMVFREVSVRVFAKNRDRDFRKQVAKCFQDYISDSTNLTLMQSICHESPKHKGLLPPVLHDERTDPVDNIRLPGDKLNVKRPRSLGDSEDSSKK